MKNNLENYRNELRKVLMDWTRSGLIVDDSVVSSVIRRLFNPLWSTLYLGVYASCVRDVQLQIGIRDEDL